MARHDGLRLRVDDELPRQWLDSSVEAPLTIIDLPANTADPDAAFQSLLEERLPASCRWATTRSLPWNLSAPAPT